MRYVALLRGINVSGQKKILMKDLRELLSKNENLQNIKTYIQTGNVIFDSDLESTSQLSEIIHTYIYRAYNFKVPVITSSKSYWDEIIKGNPYLNDKTIDINHVSTTILEKKPTKENIAILKTMNFYPDTYIISERIIYTVYPNGVGRSKMTNSVFEKKMETAATSRNWKTMCKIQEFLSS